MKRCSHCRADKALDEFPPSKRTLDRKSSWCRLCHYEATRRWRVQQGDAYREAYNAARRQGPVEIACVSCGGRVVTSRPTSRMYCDSCKRRINLTRQSEQNKLRRKEDPEWARRDDRRRNRNSARRARVRRLLVKAERLSAWPPAPPLMLVAGPPIVEKVRKAPTSLVIARPRRHVFYAGWCIECESLFATWEPNTTCCSTACTRRSARRRRRSVRRGRLAGVLRESISHAKVAERDYWKCHICGGLVTRDNWSIDHLVPLSLGGSHTYSNVALAHMLCNSRRGVATDFVGVGADLRLFS